MEKNGFFIFLRKDSLERGLVSVYSFLKNNVWFLGDIIICHIEGEIDEKEKLKFLRLYDQTVFIEISENSYNTILDKHFSDKNSLNSADIVRHLVNREFLSFDKIFVAEPYHLFVGSIRGRYTDNQVYVNIDDIDGVISSNELNKNEEINDEVSVIKFTMDTKYWIGRTFLSQQILREYEEEIRNGGPFYVLSAFDVEKRFPKHFSDRHKYLVFTCAKNENDYIEEWVQHYLELGFDKIILCDNNEPGDNSLYMTLKEYVDLGVVEIFDCSEFNCFQVQFYSQFCTDGNYMWCGFFDCDEFLELPSYFNVKHYLSDKVEDCVSFHWLVYGSNGKIKKESGTIKERFKYPVSPVTMFVENCFVKSIVRGGEAFRNGCWFNGSHIPMTTPMYTHNVGGHFLTNSTRHCYFPPKYKDGYIRHYYTKSFEEWAKKSSRGWPDGTDTLIMGNYMVCEDMANLPLDKMRMGLFSTYRTKEENEEYYGKFLQYSDVINIDNDSENIYGLILGMYNIMSICTDCTFILGDKHIEDTVFNMLLEYGIKTGNRVVWAETIEEKLNVVKKYSKISDTYYSIRIG